MSSLPPPSQAGPPSSKAWEQHREMLRQHQSMPSLPTRYRADQPNSGVWEYHKETLRQLYLLQGKPLKEVMALMRQEHDFEATDKMYKYHFKRWNFRKNMTKDESRSYEADAVAGRAVILPASNGRELGSQRLRARIGKSTSFGFPASEQHPIKFNHPDIFRHTELALHAIQNHSKARLKGWDLAKYHQDNTATELWASAMCLAAHAISTGNDVGSNYRILNRSAAEFSSVLQKQEPILIWSTFTVIIELLRLGPRLGMAFIKVVAEFCFSYLPKDDPLKGLWTAIMRIDPENIPELIARLTRAQIDFFRGRREIAATNRFLLNYIRTSAKHLHDRGLLASQATHDQMDAIIGTLRAILNSGLDTSASISDRLIAAYLFKACIHLDDGEYREVEAILDEVGPESHHDNGMSKPQMVNFYEIKAEMLLKRGQQERGDYVASEQYYWKALTTAQQSLAEKLPSRIGYCFVALGHFYAAMGNTEAVKRVQALYEEYLTQMAGDVARHPPYLIETVKNAKRIETGRHLELEKAYRREVEEVLQSRTSVDRMAQVADALSHLGPGQHTIDIDVRWKLSDFVSQGLDDIKDLPAVMTITGEPAESYVDSCEGYIKATWGNHSSVVEFFQNFVNSGLDVSSISAERIIFSSSELSVSVAIKHAPLTSHSDVFNFRITATEDHLIGVSQCILWLATVCRPPKSGSVYASRATFEMVGVDRFEVEAKPLRPLPPSDNTATIGCCWLNMFDGGYVLAQGFPTRPRRCGRGIEIPFEIMIEQAMTYHAISHTTDCQDCLILKGSHTALVPVYVDGLESIDRTNEIQWHLVGRKPKLTPIGAATDREDNENLALTDVEFSEDDPELSWEDIDQRGLKIYPIHRIQDVAQKRSFVGHFPRAQILAGTDEEVYHDLPEGPKANPVQGNVIKFGQAMTLTFGTNAATGGLLTMSASATIKRSKYDPVPKQVKALIGDKLRRDCNKPHILYDIRTRIAWMIPEACVVLYLIHYWATLQTDINPSSEQTDHQQLSDSIRKLMPFIRPTSNGGRDAALAIWKAFQDPKELPKQIRFFDEPNNSVSVVDIIRNMYMAIDTLTEHQKRKKPGFLNRLLSRPELCGYDLADVAGFNEAPVKRVSVDKDQCGGWLELTNADKRIVVLFGNNFGELIKYEAGQMICHQWKSVPSSHDFLSAESGTLEYLLDFDRRGRPGIFLSDRFSSISNHGQGRCKEGAWPCCNMTLQLTQSQPDVIIQVDKGKAVVIGRVNGAGSTYAYRRVIGPAIGKREARADETSTQERLKVPRLDHPSGSFTSPGACAHCSGANHLDNGSNSGNSSPETERDMAAGSETSNTATPQSGYTASSY